MKTKIVLIAKKPSEPSESSVKFVVFNKQTILLVILRYMINNKKLITIKLKKNYIYFYIW